MYSFKTLLNISTVYYIIWAHESLNNVVTLVKPITYKNRSSKAIILYLINIGYLPR